VKIQVQGESIGDRVHDFSLFGLTRRWFTQYRPCKNATSTPEACATGPVSTRS
jgi:hypothetical protein